MDEILHVLRFWLCTQNVKYQLLQSFVFLMYVKVDQMLSKIRNVYKKGEFNLTMSEVAIKEFSLSYIHLKSP